MIQTRHVPTVTRSASYRPYPRKPVEYVRIKACPGGMYEVYRGTLIQGVASSIEEAETLAKEIRRGL